MVREGRAVHEETVTEILLKDLASPSARLHDAPSS